MPKIIYDKLKGLYSETGEGVTFNDGITITGKATINTSQEDAGLEVYRNLTLNTAQGAGIDEVSGSLLSLKGRQEGIHFHIGGHQYLSNNAWFDGDTGEWGSWIYETDSSAFRYGFRASAGAFEMDWAEYGTTGDVVTFETGLSMTGSNGAIGIGKKATSGLSATFDITGSNSIALAVTGSADIGGGAADAYIIFPRHDNTTRDALAAVAGMVIYNTQTNRLNYYNGSGWQVVSVD
jgi:hypothetical protein